MSTEKLLSVKCTKKCIPWIPRWDGIKSTITAIQNCREIKNISYAGGILCNLHCTHMHAQTQTRIVCTQYWCIHKTQAQVS